MFDDNVIGGIPNYPQPKPMDRQTFKLFLGPLLTRWMSINYLSRSEMASMICPQPVRFVGSIVVMLAAAISECFLFYSASQVSRPFTAAYSFSIKVVLCALVLCQVAAIVQVILQLKRRKTDVQNLQRFLHWVEQLKDALQLNSVPELCAMTWNQMEESAQNILIQLALSHLKAPESGPGGIIFMDLEWSFKVLKCWQLVPAYLSLEGLIEQVSQPLQTVLLTGSELTQSAKQ